jgi:hypothetical protein
MKQKIKKITMWTFLIILTYLIVGLIIHHWILPTKTPDLNQYFKVGQSFNSKLEGLTQTIVKVENGQLTTEIEINRVRDKIGVPLSGQMHEVMSALITTAAFGE